MLFFEIFHIIHKKNLRNPLTFIIQEFRVELSCKGADSGHPSLFNHIDIFVLLFLYNEYFQLLNEPESYVLSTYK